MTYHLQPPSEEEMAAITAVVEAAWPRPRPAGQDDETPPTAWRFSGRWWSRPLVARRERPWRW
ncbi:MAG TPA: hypothetical protein VFH50_03495 [Acidimicrobiales bacterium]|nr:hypothetical protein [Acidimicrobiales bacterium]